MIRLARGLGLALVLLTYAAPVAARHGAVLIDARRATPGITLTLVERPATGTAPATYRLAATGVPRGVLFGIWTKDFGQPYQQVAAGLHLSQAGVLETSDDDGRGRRLDEIVLDPGAYPRGAIWEVALVSADQSVMAFAKVTPRPMVARDGACAVGLELVSRRGDRFVAAAQGFAPGEIVVVEQQHAGGTSQKRVLTPAEGRLPLDVITHGVAGPQTRARYAVKGRACAVAIDYAWGEPALTRQ